MAPYVGVTLETFTGIIGVVLAGIAAGAWLGGRAADEVPPRTCSARCWSCRVCSCSRSDARRLGGTVDAGRRSGRDHDPHRERLLLALADVVDDHADRRQAAAPLARGDRSVVGSFSAVGTIGALAGPFVTGFVLLAAVPSRSLVLIVGLVLVVAGLPLLLRIWSTRAGALGVVAALGVGGGLLVAEGPCDVETTYFCASIEADPANPSGRTLRLDTLRHSYVDLEDPTHLEFRYSGSWPT